MNSNNRHKAIRASYLSLAGNVILAIAKGITGVLGNSYALIADAIESITDAFASVLVILGLHYATRPADENHPYGHGRIEPLITFAVVGILLVSATLIAYEAVINIQTPQKTPEKYTLIVLTLIIAIKETLFRLVMRKAKETNSSSLRADAWHHRADALTSLVAFIGISIAVVMGDGYETADDWAALAASAFIFYNAYRIFRPALGELMDEQIHQELVQAIRDKSKELPGVRYTEKCHIRKTGLTFHVDLHLVVDGQITVEKGHEIAHNLKDTLLEAFPEIADVLIHVEPDNIY